MSQRRVAEVVKALENGAIETFGYSHGVKSKGYRLAKRFLGDCHIRRPATDTRLIERIERERDKQKANEQKTRWKPIHYWLNEQQRHLAIQSDADAILGELPYHTRLCQSVLVGNIRRREYPFSVSTTGRCFNAITGLKRELRTALRIDGEHVGSLDIRCAQPALLALLNDSQFPSNGVNTLQAY